MVQQLQELGSPIFPSGVRVIGKKLLQVTMLKVIRKSLTVNQAAKVHWLTGHSF